MLLLKIESIWNTNYPTFNKHFPPQISLIMRLLHLFLLIFDLFIVIDGKKHKNKHKKHKKLAAEKTVQVVPSLSVNIPLIENVPVSCPCAAASSNSGPCHPSIYHDYYYNPPYTGYAANSSYFPPSDSIPAIIERLTDIRDTVNSFVKAAKEEHSDTKQALYIKSNYKNVHYILKSISKASNSSQS